MEKNPISFLQEYMSKFKRTLPVYTIISEKSGTHINSFTIKVECNGCSANGTGSSKKEAKVQAAQNMIKLLKVDSTICQSTAIKINNSYETTRSESPSPSALGINYIGKLQERVRDSALIEYIFNEVGPPHNRTFICVCKYKNVEKEGTGKTKKEAKLLAAKEMLHYLLNHSHLTAQTWSKQEQTRKEKERTLCKTIQTGDWYVDTRVDTVQQEGEIEHFYAERFHSLELELAKMKLEEKSTKNDNILMQNSLNKALNHYKKLKSIKEDNKSVTENYSFNTCSNYFIKNFPLDTRKIVAEQLINVIKSCSDKDIFTNRNFYPIRDLKKALVTMNIELQIVNYKKKENIKKFLIGLKMLTNPPISEIGFGDDIKVAEIKAVIQMAYTLIILM